MPNNDECEDPEEREPREFADEPWFLDVSLLCGVAAATAAAMVVVLIAAATSSSREWRQLEKDHQKLMETIGISSKDRSSPLRRNFDNLILSPRLTYRLYRLVNPPKTSNASEEHDLCVFFERILIDQVYRVLGRYPIGLCEKCELRLLNSVGDLIDFVKADGATTCELWGQFLFLNFWSHDKNFLDTIQARSFALKKVSARDAETDSKYPDLANKLGICATDIWFNNFVTLKKIQYHNLRQKMLKHVGILDADEGQAVRTLLMENMKQYIEGQKMAKKFWKPYPLLLDSLEKVLDFIELEELSLD